MKTELESHSKVFRAGAISEHESFPRPQKLRKFKVIFILGWYWLTQDCVRVKHEVDTVKNAKSP